MICTGTVIKCQRFFGHGAVGRSKQLLHALFQEGWLPQPFEDRQRCDQRFDLQLQSLQSDIGSTDIAEAASRMSQELLALQASQQSFVKIQELSLFNRIG